MLDDHEWFSCCSEDFHFDCSMKNICIQSEQVGCKSDLGVCVHYNECSFCYQVDCRFFPFNLPSSSGLAGGDD